MKTLLWLVLALAGLGLFAGGDPEPATPGNVGEPTLPDIG